MNKILFIGSFLSSQQGTLGVSENLSKELSKKGFIVKTCSRRKNKVFRIIEIIYCCLFSKYDVLHIDVFSGNAFKIAQIASLIGEFRRKKIVFTLHGGMLKEYYCKNKFRFQRVFKRANLISSPSNYLINFFYKQGFKVQYIPNSIDLNRFPYKKELIRSQSILWVRAFSDIYCPEVVIEAFRLVHVKYPEAKLTMIGPDKGKMKYTKNLIDKYGLTPFITITGPIPNNELYKFYHSHAVFLNTTTYESFGVCVAEAASCGIPIISNNVGELPYIWEDKLNILFVKENNPFEFAQNIEKLFIDDELAKKMKSNAKNVSIKFDTKVILEIWLKLFSN